MIIKKPLAKICAGISLGLFPIMQSSHAELIVDPNAPTANQSQTTQSLNGTPVQNIAAPNASGLSHNMFSTFNVGVEGLVINNSSVDVVSNIGGALVANPNLAGGEATLILNEVTSGNRSVLQGQQELVGGQADYILANPNGITCKGCGFINFPRATITTGAPILNGGNLSGLDVDGGDILVEGNGLNATGADYFEIISRSMVINGQINANDLSLTAGRNTVDYATRVATAKAADGSTSPAFAIDSSILGGMYAGRISLVGTEAGVGVRLLGNMAASVDDILLDINGKITFKDNNVSAARDVTIKSWQAAAIAGNEIELSGTTLYADGNTTLSGGDIALTGGRTGAGSNLSITANSYIDTGSGLRDAGNDLSLTVTGNATVDASVLQAVNNASISAANLALQNSGKIMAASNGTGNLGVAISNGLTLTNAALGSGNTATISAKTISTDANSNDSGAKGIHAKGAATITATTSITNDGLIAGDGGLSVNTATLNNTGSVSSTGDLALKADTLTNNAAGVILGTGAVTIAGNGGATTSLTTESTSSIKGKSLSATFASISNAGLLYGTDFLTLTTQMLTNASTGEITTPGALTLKQSAASGSMGNSGKIQGGTLALTYDTLTNSAGEIYAKSAGTLGVKTLVNAAKIYSDGALNFNTDLARGLIFTNSSTGVIDAGTLGLFFSSISNDGTLYTTTSASVGASTLTNTKSIYSGGDLTLSVADLTNTATDIIAYGDIVINNNHTLINEASATKQARIIAQTGSLSIISKSGDITTQSVENNGGLLYGYSGLTAEVSRQFLNQAYQGFGAYTYANQGLLKLGATATTDLGPALPDVLVKNIDSQIENKTGNISIIASTFENTTSSALPLTETLPPYSLTGGYWFDGVNSYPIDGPNCGTIDDPGFSLGDTCVKQVAISQQVLPSGTSSAPRSRLIAGGNLDIWAETAVVNKVSLMSAGGNVTIEGAAGATFSNEAVNLTTTQSATVYTDKDGGDAVAANLFSFFTLCGTLAYSTPPAGNPCFWVGITEHFKAWTTQDKTYSFVTPGIPSTIQAGGLISITLADVTNGANVGTQQNGSSTVTAPTVNGPTDPNSGTATISSQTLNATLLSSISAVASSPFFVTNSNPTAPFLYETDPVFLNLQNLYGSDLFLTSLGLDPIAYLRLGDPYFEQQLLRQQLLDEAGQIFIANGMANENDQYKYLLDNGVQAVQDLQLSPGVALTAEQINSLEKDVVLMVWTEVDGIQRLAPQLYLCNTTRADLASGAKFVASDIKIKTEGSITNSGAFVASNNIDVNAGTTFTNSQGTLVANNDLNITATSDVLNQSGTIRGGDVAISSTQGSVINETLTREETVDGAFGKGTNTIVGNTATIEATNNLKISAGENIISRGGDIKAGNNAVLDAQEDITLTAIEKKSYNESSETSVSGNKVTSSNQKTQKTEMIGSGLTVGGNLTTKAGNDINIEASNVDVTGDAKLDAGRDINITALAETSHDEQNSLTSSWNSLAVESTTIDQTTGKASSLTTGGSLTISSGGNTNIKGSDLEVAGDLNVEKIGGNLNVSTFENTTKVQSTSFENSFFSGAEAKAEAGKDITESEASASATLSKQSFESTDMDSTTNRGSTIVIGGGLNAGKDANGQDVIQGDVNIKGSGIATGGDLNLGAKGNINILAADDKTTINSSSTSNQFNLGASATIDGAEAKFGAEHNESNGTATQTTAQVSSLSSGGKIDINAGKDFTEQGSQVEGRKGISVEAESINSLAAQNTYTESGDKLSVTVEIGVKVETGLADVVGSFINDKTHKAEFNMADASKSLSKLDIPDASAELSVSTEKTTYGSSGNSAVTSGFTSGGDVSLKARSGDATFEGTNVQADGSIAVTAEKGSINIKAAESKDTSNTDTTTAKVTVRASAEGNFSGEGSGGTEHEDSNSTTQTAASFKAGKNLDLTAKKDVILVGTNLEAGDTASITAEEGEIDFQAARNTTETNSNSVSANANASFGGGEAGLGGGGGTTESHEKSVDATVGSIKANNINLKSKGDITLEGTTIDAKETANIETEGKLDYKAVEDTYSKTTKETSAQVDLEGGKKSGGISVEVELTDESEQSSKKTGGSLTAANLNIKTGGGVRLEGTQVDASKDASIDAGKGKLVIESAVSTSTKRVNNTSVELSLKADKKEKSGQAGLQIDLAKEDTQNTTNQNASIKVGGKADINAAHGIDIKGKDVTGVDSVVKAGTLDTHNAAVNVEQRQDVNISNKSDFDLSVGAFVPSKKTRDKITNTAKKTETGTAIANKLENAGSSLSNAADTVKNRVKNTASDISTKVKNIGTDDAIRVANNKKNADTKDANNRVLADSIQKTKDQATTTKLQNKIALAERKETVSNKKTTAKQDLQDQKADDDRQKADDAATKQRDKDVAALSKDKTLDDQARQEKKQEIENTFEKAKSTNAETAVKAKAESAKIADDSRAAYADKTANRKIEAENKAADSNSRHAEDAATTKLALVDMKPDSSDKDQLKSQIINDRNRTITDLETSRERKVSDIEAKNKKTQDVKDAKANRIEADKNADIGYNNAIKAADIRKARKEADIEKDANLSEQQKRNEKEKIASQAEQDKKIAAQDLEKARKDSVQQEALDLAGADKDYADSRADAKSRQENLLIRSEYRQKVADSESVRDKAHKDVDNELAKRVNVVESEYARKLEQADYAYEAKRSMAEDIRKASEDSEKAKFEVEYQKIKDQKLSADKEQEALKKNRDAYDAKLKKLDEDYNDALIKPKADQLAVIKAAEKEKSNKMAAAESDVLKRKGEADKAFAQQKQAAEEAAKDRQQLADSKRDEQKALIAANDKKARDDQTVLNDSSLNDGQKVDKLKANAEAYADAELAAKTKRVDEEKRVADAKDVRDSAQEKAEVDADSGLSASEKQARKQEIDQKYQALSEQRKKDHESTVEQAKTEAILKKDIADAEHQHRLDLAQGKKNLEGGLNKAEADKTAADQNALTEKQRKEVAIDANLSDAKKQAKQKEIDKAYQKSLADNKVQFQKDRANAVAKAGQEKAEAGKELKSRKDLSVTRNKAHKETNDELGRQTRVAEDAYSDNVKNADKARDVKLEKVAQDRKATEEKIDKDLEKEKDLAETVHVDTVANINKIYEGRRKAEENARKTAEASAKAAFEVEYQKIKEQKLSADKEQEALKKNKDAYDAKLKEIEEAYNDVIIKPRSEQLAQLREAEKHKADKIKAAESDAQKRKDDADTAFLKGTEEAADKHAERLKGASDLKDSQLADAMAEAKKRKGEADDAFNLKTLAAAEIVRDKAHKDVDNELARKTNAAESENAKKIKQADDAYEADRLRAEDIKKTAEASAKADFDAKYEDIKKQKLPVDKEQEALKKNKDAYDAKLKETEEGYNDAIIKPRAEQLAAIRAAEKEKRSQIADATTEALKRKGEADDAFNLKTLAASESIRNKEHKDIDNELAKRVNVVESEYARKLEQADYAYEAKRSRAEDIRKASEERAKKEFEDKYQDIKDQKLSVDKEQEALKKNRDAYDAKLKELDDKYNDALIKPKADQLAVIKAAEKEKSNKMAAAESDALKRKVEADDAFNQKKQANLPKVASAGNTTASDKTGVSAPTGDKVKTSAWKSAKPTVLVAAGESGNKSAVAQQTPPFSKTTAWKPAPPSALAGRVNSDGGLTNQSNKTTVIPTAKGAQSEMPDKAPKQPKDEPTKTERNQTDMPVAKPQPVTVPVILGTKAAQSPVPDTAKSSKPKDEPVRTRRSDQNDTPVAKPVDASSPEVSKAAELSVLNETQADFERGGPLTSPPPGTVSSLSSVADKAQVPKPAKVEAPAKPDLLTRRLDQDVQDAANRAGQAAATLAALGPEMMGSETKRMESSQKEFDLALQQKMLASTMDTLKSDGARQAAQRKIDGLDAQRLETRLDGEQAFASDLMAKAAQPRIVGSVVMPRVATLQAAPQYISAIAQVKGDLAVIRMQMAERDVSVQQTERLRLEGNLIEANIEAKRISDLDSTIQTGVLNAKLKATEAEHALLMKMLPDAQDPNALLTQANHVMESIVNLHGLRAEQAAVNAVRKPEPVKALVTTAKGAQSEMPDKAPKQPKDEPTKTERNQTDMPVAKPQPVTVPVIPPAKASQSTLLTQ